MPKNNAAGRLLTILSRAAEVPQNTVATDGWVQLLGLQAVAGSGLAQDREVVRLVGLLNDELEAVHGQLADLSIDKAAYEAQLARIASAFSVRMLGGGWQQITQQVTPDTLNILRFVSEVLPAPEEPLEPDHLASARRAVDEMRLAANAADLPKPVREFLERQILLIERALWEYPIRGAEAFRARAQEAAVEWVAAREAMAPYQDDPAVAAVRGFWDGVKTWSTRVTLVGGLATALLGATRFALEKGHAAGLLSPGSAVEQLEHLLNHDTLHGGNGAASPPSPPPVTPGVPDAGPGGGLGAPVVPGPPASTAA